jgi:hypothetical protein
MCVCIARLSCKSRDSCRQLFKTIQILPLPSQYILTLLLFVVKNRSQHRTNSEVHDLNTRQHYNLHQPLSNLVKYQKGVYYVGMVFNSLPSHIKHKSDNYGEFKLILKHFLHNHSFYSLKEYFQYNKKQLDHHHHHHHRQ